MLRDAAIRAGLRPSIVVWNDPTVPWESFDAALIRSTWDYPDHVEDFLRWARMTSQVTRLLNPELLIRWNIDKRYLADLSAAGVPTVPTRYLAPADTVPSGHYSSDLDSPDLAEALAALEITGSFVVKPTVSAGARDTARYAAADDDAALRHVRRLHENGKTAMIQPYLDAVDTLGERALLFFGGVFSHAVAKGAVLDATTGVRGGDAHPEVRTHEPSAAELETALATLAAVPGGPETVLYARIDLIETADGTPVLIEAELIEPHLFLSWSEGSPDRLTQPLAQVTALR
jgi:hypothetical protein